MLDAVYVDTIEEKSIVAITTKPCYPVTFVSSVVARLSGHAVAQL